MICCGKAYENENVPSERIGTHCAELALATELQRATCT